MSEAPEMGTLYLTTGGESPAVHALDIQRANLKGSLDMRTVGTAYAGSFNPSRTRLSFGTKLGNLVCGRAKERGGVGHWEIVQIGDAILSVAFLDDVHLCVATLAGETLVFDARNPTEAALVLRQEGPAMCALERLPEERLAALDMRGTVFVWESPLSGSKPRSISGPAPPPLGASVKLLYWPAIDRLVYAATGGGLAFVDPENCEVRVVPAHTRDFYVLIPLTDGLISMGYFDGLMNLWRPDGSSPAALGAVPKGLISGAALVGAQRRMVVADHQGGVRLMGEYGEMLGKEESLDCVRTIVGLDSLAYAVLEREWRCLEAHRRRNEAIGALQRQDWGQYEAHLDGLGKIGYGHDAEELRAWAAESQGHFAEAVRHRANLLDNLPLVPESAPCLQDAARLFERVGLPAEALRAYKRVAEIDRTAESIDAIERLSEQVKSLSEGDCVFEAGDDISRDDLIECARISEHRNASWYVYRRLDCWPCPGVSLTLREVSETYTRIMLEKRGRGLPEPEIRDLHWWRGQTRERVRGVLFSMPTEGASKLCLWIRLQTREHDSAVDSVILVRQADQDCGEPVESEDLESVAKDPMTNLWLGKTIDALGETLWRVKNRKAAEAGTELPAASAMGT